MDIDEPGWALIDDFFRTEAQGKSAATVRRYARVRQRLMTFLDTGDMSLGLGTYPATLLEAERQFHQTGAFWSLFGPGELVCCLPSFLHETWLPEGIGETRTHISLVGRMVASLSRHADFDWKATSCAWYEAEAAVRQARRDLARRSSAPAASSEQVRMPPRFHQLPGPQW